MNRLNFDPTLKVGDYVFCDWRPSEVNHLFKVLEITRNFVTADQLQYVTSTHHPYYGMSVGDEIAPIIRIQSVTSIHILLDPAKKHRKKGHRLDAYRVTKATPQFMNDYIQKLQKLATELWP
jgi:hypothetical protein